MHGKSIKLQMLEFVEIGNVKMLQRVYLHMKIVINYIKIVQVKVKVVYLLVHVHLILLLLYVLLLKLLIKEVFVFGIKLLVGN